MEPLQIIAILFALFFLSRIILRFKDTDVSLKEMILWTLLVISMIVLAIDPEIIQFISNWFGVSRPIDLVVYSAVLVMFYLIFRMYIKIENIKNDITEIVRAISLKKK